MLYTYNIYFRTNTETAEKHGGFLRTVQYFVYSAVFYGRMTEFFPQLPVIITFVGIAYHMLKAVDVMYFVYYTDMDIPFLTYVNYMLFFPTFTAGPIFRYRDFQKVYNKPVPLTTDRFITCVKRFIKGMFKKMVVLLLCKHIL